MEGVCKSNAAMQHAGRTGQDREDEGQGRKTRYDKHTPRPGLRHKQGCTA